ncbi:MAG TPA: hypothetical protein VGM32_20540 [Rhodopila sp.]|jgi:hypothetical protein
MIPECGELLEGLVRLQTAGMVATAVAAARGVRLTLRQGRAMAESMTGVFEQPQTPGGSHWDAALREIYDGHVDYLREVVGLPRLSLMFFLDELHRLGPFMNRDD